MLWETPLPHKKIALGDKASPFQAEKQSKTTQWLIRKWCQDSAASYDLENSFKKLTGFNSTCLKGISTLSLSPAPRDLEIPLKADRAFPNSDEEKANSIPQRPMYTLDIGIGLSAISFSIFFGKGPADWTFFSRKSAVGHRTGIFFKAADHAS